MENQTKKIKTLTWAGSGVAVVAIVVAVAASWLLYNYTISLLTENLRERLLSISITQAANIEAAEIEALQTEADWNTDEWRNVVTRLKKAKDSNPDIVFMYVFRKTKQDPAQMEFVADAESINPYANTDADTTNDVDANGDGVVESDGADKLQWPGQPYPEAVDIPETFEAYGGPLTARELYEDAYGQVLTGYAPIKDTNGKVVAVLAADIKAGDFFTVTRQTLYPFVIFIAGLIVIISLLAGTLIYLWRRRAETLARLRQELEIVNDRQETLIHFIGHEVKGFLTKDAGAFAALVEGDLGPIPEAAKPFIASALEQSRAGADSVAAILKASNLKKGTVTYDKKPFDMKALVATAVARAQSLVTAKGLKLNFSAGEESYQLVGDAAQINDHVLRNLIENAINYTPSGSVDVSIARKDKNIVFAVKDSGVGITDEDKKHLFTEGGHGENSQKINVHSTGYGLYIAKQITEAHGGTIRAESEGAGKGSTFTVEFPA